MGLANSRPGFPTLINLIKITSYRHPQGHLIAESPWLLLSSQVTFTSVKFMIKVRVVYSVNPTETTCLRISIA